MSRARETRQPGSIPPEDWDLLFDAVAWRLLQSARDAMAAPARAAVEDCVKSLELLHVALVQERGNLCRIELELLQARAALAAAQAELVNSQRGERRPSARPSPMA